MANADVVLIEGGNMAEAHPVGFRWVMKAKERGATVIHVDPRYGRTSQMADRHVADPRRHATSSFLGALIRHVLETEVVLRGVRPQLHERRDARQRATSRTPRTSAASSAAGTRRTGSTTARPGRTRAATSRSPGRPARALARSRFEAQTGAGMMVGDVKTDPTLEHPRCVINVLRRHYARYTPEMVERICGIAREDFEFVADALIANSGRERTGMIAYAVGWTQHTAGVQMIRAAAILQLLLGNVGRPGGGIMAMRGHASIQGSTDIPTLFDLLPGYLHMPSAHEGEYGLKEYMAGGRADRGWWSFFDTYIVSLLKAWFGDAATAENDYGFGHLPKITGSHSHFATMLRAHRRRRRRPVPHGPEPGGRLAARGPAAPRPRRRSSGSSCATSPRSRARRSGATAPR